MNIADIARKARVSTATVSRTLNGSPLVRAKTAANVRKVIEETKYVPNSSARSLSSGRSNLFGVIISDINNPFFPDIVSSFERLAVDASYEVIFANTSYDEHRLEHCIQRMMERRVDGIAVLTSEMHESAITLLQRQTFPVVTLRSRLGRHNFQTISVDYRMGIEEAVQHLTDLGHRKLAYIAGPSTLWSANRRRSVFLAELKRRNLKLPAGCLVEANARVEGGYAAMKQILALKDRPTAILAINDVAALGALKAIYEARLEVPGDFSLIGFDDIEMSTLVHPALTTIRIPRMEIAAQAFRALHEFGKPGRKNGVGQILRTKLIVRESTSVPRGDSR